MKIIYLNTTLQELSFVELHQGVSELDLVESFKCGMAVPSYGIPLLDSWELPVVPK